MKPNTIYLAAIILSVIFIAIFGLCLAILKPKSEIKDTDGPQSDRGGEQSEDRHDNKNDGGDDNSNDLDDQNDVYSKPKPKPKPKPEGGPEAKPVGSFNENCVPYHNNYRSKHKQTSAISFSKTLMNSAQIKADLMARTGDFSHTPNLESGENLWYTRISRGSAAMFASLDCIRPLKAWYDEEVHYNYRSPTSSSGVVGHFTQMVWRDTTQVGCAKSHSRERGSIYVVCHYMPPGNVIGTYPQNVQTKI